MADPETTVKEMLDVIRHFRQERDWAKYHTPKNLAMGIAIEAAELMEHFQWLTAEESLQVVHDEKQLQLIREETADVLAYVLNIADVLGFDLSEAFFEKMKKNALKYPAEAFRGKFKK